MLSQEQMSANAVNGRAMSVVSEAIVAQAHGFRSHVGSSQCQQEAPMLSEAQEQTAQARGLRSKFSSSAWYT